MGISALPSPIQLPASHSVAAAIVTHRRSAELKRLLENLSASQIRLAGCVISDHAPGGETKAIAAGAGIETVVLDDPSNPGPGAGWKNAAQEAFRRFPHATAIWFLDDDVTVSPEALGTLLEEMKKARAAAIAPLLEDSGGRLWALPEPEPAFLRGPIREAITPADARKLLGDEPIPFCWCTGASFLVTREAIDRAGWHRADFWMLGEDLEYSMRVASTVRSVFTCRVSIPHLPPSGAAPRAARKSDYLKFCSLLQNLSYLAFHSPHSRHMKRYLPGNFRRFFRTHSAAPRTIRDAVACFWNGAVQGQPAGGPGGERLRRRVSHYEF